MVAPTDAKQIREAGICNSVDAATIGVDVRILAVTPAGTKDELITISELAKLTGGGVLHNLDAARDPQATDDIGSGYVVGSLWRNDTSGNTWAASSVAAGAAVWDPIGSVSDLADNAVNLAGLPAVGGQSDGYRAKVATNGLTYVVIDGAYEVEDYEIRVATDLARTNLTEQETGQRVNVDADDKRYRWDGAAWQEIVGGTSGTVHGIVRTNPTADVAPTEGGGNEIDPAPQDGSWAVATLSNGVREVWFRDAGVWTKQATWAPDENILTAEPPAADYNDGDYIWLNQQATDAENGLYQVSGGMWVQRGYLDAASGGIGEVNTASNVGTGVGILKAKVGVDFELRSVLVNAIQAGILNVSVVGDDLVIEANDTMVTGNPPNNGATGWDLNAGLVRRFTTDGDNTLSNPTSRPAAGKYRTSVVVVDKGSATDTLALDTEYRGTVDLGTAAGTVVISMMHTAGDTLVMGVTPEL